MVDNAPVQIDYDAAAGTLALELPEGPASVVLGDKSLRVSGLGVDWEIEQ